MRQLGVLFVDDDAGVLSSLRRMLHPLRGEWRMRFAESGQEALEIMDEEDFDVVVSDMRMPVMNGAQLLAKVKFRHPGAARIILTGHSDREMAIHAIGVAHQYLNKPCEKEELVAVIRRTTALRELLSGSEIRELANSVTRAPSLPENYLAINAVLAGDAPSMDKIVAIVEKDPAMTATVLRLANSGFFGVQTRIESVFEAISLLGTELLRSLALAAGIFGRYEDTPTFSITDFSARAIRVAGLARKLATGENYSRKTAEEVFISALLCDIGLLVLATGSPDRYAQVRAAASEKGSITGAEKEIFGATHAYLGAYLMGLWGFPDEVSLAVAFHHCPSLAPVPPAPGALFYTHVADALVGPCLANPENAALDLNYLAAAGMTHRLADWKADADHFLSSKAHDAENPVG
jgi:HD-like signal output (HDOD) protein/CheY-like chemotaxis protein